MAEQGTGNRAAASRRPMGLWRKLLLSMLLLPFAALFLPTLVVLLLGLLPTLGAYVADRGREKHLAVTVGLLNICGCLPALFDLWATGQSYNAMSMAIQDVYNWLVAYGAAGCGWLIYLSMPPFVHTYYKVASEARIQMLRRAQRKLIELWGEEVVASAAQEAGPDAS